VLPTQKIKMGDVGAKTIYYFVYPVDLVYQELGESDRKG